jgi:hypothetical protein
VLQGEILAADGSWKDALFLVDTGSDRTVFSANVLQALQLGLLPAFEQLGGVGGEFASVAVETRIQFPREDGVMVGFRGRFAAATNPEALDMSVLGRDITDAFAVIVDRPGNIVCLLGQRHRYNIEAT